MVIENKSLALDTIVHLFNRNLIAEAKLNQAELLYYFTKVVQTPTLSYKVLCELIRDYDSDSLTPVVIKSALVNQANNSDEQADQIISKLYVAHSAAKSDVDQARENLKKFCYQAAIQKATTEHKGNEAGYLKQLAQYQYKVYGSSNMTVSDIKDMDVTTLAERYLNKPIKSTYSMINKSYSGHQGYLRGSLVTICAAPKVGKSLFCMREAATFVMQGYKVHYLALGDLNELDLIARTSSMVTNTDMDITYSDLRPARDKFIEKMYKNGGRLGVTCESAGKISPEEYKELVDHNLKDYDVLIIDYDYNFKDSSDNMYEQGGILYNFLAQITDDTDKLILVATQPSKAYWNEGFLDDGCLGQSSKKQMVIDTLITLGKYKQSGTHCGWMNIPLQRRGSINMSPYIRTTDGNIQLVPEELLSVYQGDTKRRDISNEELRSILKGPEMRDIPGVELMINDPEELLKIRKLSEEVQAAQIEKMRNYKAVA